jgi:hypothetical protein
MHIMHIMHTMHTRETLSYFVYYAYCAYTSHVYASEQGSAQSAGHSASSSVQQQQGSPLHLLYTSHRSYKTSRSYANIVIAFCAKENA